MVFPRFYSTYEELKPIHFDDIGKFYIMVFTVPMRNWNPAFATSTGLFTAQVFTVPMRNWNHLDSLGRCAAGTCFYSTYEELKPKRSYSVCCPSSSFYSTYEELKHNKFWDVTCCCLWFLQYLWGIETDVFTCIDNGLFIVFTVPMRNWNVKL